MNWVCPHCSREVPEGRNCPTCFGRGNGFWIIATGVFGLVFGMFLWEIVKWQ
jgi:hypothetical protein